jgi:hypothetical protein
MSDDGGEAARPDADMGGEDAEGDTGTSIVPDKEKGLRACLVCSLLQVRGTSPAQGAIHTCACGRGLTVGAGAPGQTFDQFMQHGCANCPFLRLEDDRERVLACSSNAFGGCVAGWQQPVRVRARLPQALCHARQDDRVAESRRKLGGAVAADR